MRFRAAGLARAKVTTSGLREAVPLDEAIKGRFLVKLVSTERPFRPISDAFALLS